MCVLTHKSPIGPNKDAPPKTSQAIINKQFTDTKIIMLIKPKLNCSISDLSRPIGCYRKSDTTAAIVNYKVTL